uniref:DUF4939 domain-containing protein n=1 Tax=Astyanax mexicanus TaxID=7994 RepID=A0A3B1IPN2_ASTMX
AVEELAVQHQGAAIGRHEQLLLEITQQLALLIQNQASNPDAAQPVATPERYSGESDKCRGFLLQCSLVFEQQPSRFPTERSKVAFIVSLLTDRALAWATALWEQNSPECATVQAFTKALHQWWPI